MAPISRRRLLQAGAACAVAYAPCAAALSARPADRQILLEYLADTAPQLLRPATGRFQWPSVAPSLPGKEYAASLWDWDTLWTCRGLLAFAGIKGDPGFKATLLQHCQGSLLNFLAQQNSAGRLPILMTDRDTDVLRTNAEDAPPGSNQAKPVFAQLALLIAKETGFEWLRPHFDRLLSFYSAWERRNLDRCGLFVWGNDVAIGNDNDPTTFGRPEFSSANLLLNGLFAQELQDAAELARQLGRQREAVNLKARADRLAAAMRALCWDERDRFFYTVDVQCHDRRAELLPKINAGMPMRWQTLPLRLQTFTGFLPLWCGAATAEQAESMVAANYRADNRLRCESGVRSLSRLESMYSLDFSSNPSNWLGPVWIIANYLAWSGLKRYGFNIDANELAGRTVRLLASDIRRNGSMNEYYHPDTGQALSHPGFMDWNLLVLEMMA